jgi:hypothetical protein
VIGVVAGAVRSFESGLAFEIPQNRTSHGKFPGRALSKVYALALITAFRSFCDKTNFGAIGSTPDFFGRQNTGKQRVASGNCTHRSIWKSRGISGVGA